MKSIRIQIVRFEASQKNTYSEFNVPQNHLLLKKCDQNSKFESFTIIPQQKRKIYKNTYLKSSTLTAKDTLSITLQHSTGPRKEKVDKKLTSCTGIRVYIRCGWTYHRSSNNTRDEPKTLANFMRITLRTLSMSFLYLVHIVQKW